MQDLDARMTNEASALKRRKARRALAVLLAAGVGHRMHSKRPKALHEIAGQTMLAHVLSTLRESGAEAIALVVGPDHEAVAEEARRLSPTVEIFVQRERRGTAHATLAAREAIARGFDDVLVTYVDHPLIRAETFRAMRGRLSEGAGLVVLGFEPPEPGSYGRLIEKDGLLVAVREAKDATPEELSIRRCNAGTMAFAGQGALELLEAIGDENAQREYYLTDLVELSRKRGLKAVAATADFEETPGVNDRAQLAIAEAVMQRRLRLKAMRDGATLIAPETVFFSHDTRLGRDVLVEPNVVFGKGVTVEDGATIHSFSHLEGAHVAAGASIGPFARLRPGAKIGRKAKIGNFVEVKASTIEEGAKANHLSYIGDARVGANANVGAGTITCNYDGFDKHKTDIGANAFIGSNSALVAPVKIGDGAYVGSGSVVTKDVPADALAIARGRQVEKDGWAKAFRARKQKEKR